MSVRIVIAILMTVLLVACSGESNPSASSGNAAPASEPASDTNADPDDGSESAAGSDAAPSESGRSGNREPAADVGDVALLVDLGRLRGRLHAAEALYAAGETVLAERQLERPRQTMAGELARLVEARGLPGFEDAVSTFIEAVDGDAGDATEAWRAADEAVESVERGIDATPKQELMAVAGLLDHVADRYRTGVVDGFVENEHDYQASWGMQQIALQRVGQVVATSDVERGATAEAGVAVSSLEDLWPGLTPATEIRRDAGRIDAAAERIRGVANDLG